MNPIALHCALHCIHSQGMQQAEYPLNEALIDYGSAMEDQDLIKAMDILDSLLMTAEVEAMWRQLHAAAIAAGDIRISQRCAAATGTYMHTYIHDEMSLMDVPWWDMNERMHVRMQGTWPRASS